MPHLPFYQKRQRPAQERRREVDTRYNTTRWRKVRALYISAHPFCVMCQADGKVVQATVVDHIVPARKGGDFWSEENYQSLCNKCHASKSGKEARS